MRSPWPVMGLRRRPTRAADSHHRSDDQVGAASQSPAPVAIPQSKNPERLGERRYVGECSQGSFRSKNSGTPMVSASISSICAFSSGGTSFFSPSRAASSEVKYSAIV